MKICKKCHLLKDKSDFYKSGTNWDYFWCKKCCGEYKKEYVKRKILARKKLYKKYGIKKTEDLDKTNRSDMIYRIQPFSESKNLGKAYNDYIKLLPSGSWICLQDYDTCFLDHRFYINMLVYIKIFPNQGIFTCLTNRTGCVEQRYNGEIYDNPNMIHWREVSINIHSKATSLKDIGKEISGFCMLFNKNVWEEAGGFLERESRCLGIDNNFCWVVLEKGYKIGLMENVFCFHYYRLKEGIADKTHVK